MAPLFYLFWWKSLHFIVTFLLGCKKLINLLINPDTATQLYMYPAHHHVLFFFFPVTVKQREEELKKAEEDINKLSSSTDAKVDK